MPWSLNGSYTVGATSNLKILEQIDSGNEPQGTVPKDIERGPPTQIDQNIELTHCR